MLHLENQSTVEIVSNNLHPLKISPYPELEELITYLTNYLKPILLSDLQEIVLRNAWEGKTYTEIAEKTYNEPNYLKSVGANIWKILSEALSEEVTKRNIKLVTKRNYEKLKKINQDFQQAEINIPKVTKLASNTESSCNKTVTIKYRDWGEAVDVSLFYGRTEELATLKQWIVSDRCRLICLLGIGGIGKTFLAAKLARQVESEFEFVIWKSLQNQPDIKDLLNKIVFDLSDRLKLVSDTIEWQINSLMNFLRQKRCLLIFDGVENILASGIGGKYLNLHRGYERLLKRIEDEQHQSCVLIISRERPTGINLREGKNSLVRSYFLRGLAKSAALNILLDRSLIGSEFTLKQLIDRCEGNPLILKIVAGTIEVLFQGDVQIFLKYNTIFYGDVWQLLERQFQRLSNQEKQIMNYLTFENTPISFQELFKGVSSRLTHCDTIEILESLQGRSFITNEETGYLQHLLMGAYTKQKLLQVQ